MTFAPHAFITILAHMLKKIGHHYFKSLSNAKKMYKSVYLYEIFKSSNYYYTALASEQQSARSRLLS